MTPRAWAREAWPAVCSGRWRRCVSAPTLISKRNKSSTRARFEVSQTEMETVPYLDLRAQYRPLRSEVLSALEEICESTSFAQGPATSEFEAEIRSVLRS